MTFHTTLRLGLTAILAGLLSTSAPAQQPTEGAKTLREDDPATGTRINRTYARTQRIPLDKRYEAMTDDEKAAVASWYEALPAGDEPPFPAAGLRPIVQSVYAAQRKLRVRGSILVYVDVDGEGNATSVSVMQSADPEMDRFVAQLLLMTRYKPARCQGAPCRMQYPFFLSLRMD